MTANANGPNLLSFNFEQDTGQTIYDVSFACSASSNSSTGMPNANTANVFQFATSAISSGSQLNISGMQCYGSNANLFQDNPIGTVFSGTLWIQYTTVPASTNYQYAKIAKITAKVESLSSSVSSLGAPSAPGFSGPQTTPSNILYYVPIRISNPGGPTPTSVPSGIISYVPITITNGANVPTSAPFQQMVNITESQFSSYNITYSNTIANFEFFTQSGAVIPAWIESNDSGKLITWVNLPTAIPASSSVTIYIGFAPKTTNLLSSSGTTGIGEAPQLPCGNTATSVCTTYGEYDNGAKVFNFYDNFKGTSLNTSKWTSGSSIPSGASGSITINNGITLTYSGSTSNSGGVWIYSTSTFTQSQQFIWDTLENLYGSSSNDIRTREYIWQSGQTNIADNNAYSWYYLVTSKKDYGYFSNSIYTNQAPVDWVSAFTSYIVPSASSTTNYTFINQEILNSSGFAFKQLSPSETLLNSNFQSGSNSNTFVLLFQASQDNLTGTTQLNIGWTRVRAYPPNGVMPSVTFDFPQATGKGFQQMINITESSFSSYLTYNSNFANFEYFYANGTIIPSWIESNDSGKLVTWAKLSKSIPALSNATIYLGFAPKTTNLLSSSGTTGIGEAPQLTCGNTATSSCPTYAEYDDGAKVFNDYWNFAGTSLPSGLSYVNSGSTITINNGATVTQPASSSGYAWIYTTSAVASGQIIETTILPSTSEVNTRLGWSTSTSLGWQNTSYNSYDNNIGSDFNINGVVVTSSSAVGFTATPSVSTSLQGIFSFAWLATGSQWYAYNYQTATSSDTTASIASSLYGFFGVGTVGYRSGSTNSQSIYWLRIRAYPPNGVMPSITFGSVS